MKDLEPKTNEIYERLRREAPLAYIQDRGAYVASTAEICQEIARSDDFEGVLNPSGIRTFGRPCIIDENGPLHRDLRSMIDPALRATDVDRWVDALVRPIARRYIRAIEDAGHAKLLPEYFYPVSVRSLGDSLRLTAVSSHPSRDCLHQPYASLSK